MKYDITLKKIEDENSKLKAIATINIGDAFTVKGVKVYEGKDGLFVSMPNYKRNEPDSHGNEYKDICYPITADFRKELEQKIVDKYNGINEYEPEITDCRIGKIEKDSLVGLASITLDNQFVIGNIKIVNGKDGLFVSMPNYNKDGEYKDICYPTTASFREKLNNAILDKYNEIEKNKDQEKTQNEPDNNRKKHKSR